jgi:hypothetical protein
MELAENGDLAVLIFFYSEPYQGKIQKLLKFLRI